MTRFHSIITLLWIGLAVSVTACSPVETLPGDGNDAAMNLDPLRPISECIDVDRVGEWYVTDPRTVIVRTGPKYYRIDLRAACPRLGVGPGISFRLNPGNASTRRLCGDMLDAVYAGGVPCPVHRVTPINEKQFRALEDSAS